MKDVDSGIRDYEKDAWKYRFIDMGGERNQQERWDEKDATFCGRSKEQKSLGVNSQSFTHTPLSIKILYKW